MGSLSAAIITGPEVTLGNISRSGARLEVAEPFPMRTTVQLKIVPPRGEKLIVSARVIWSKVASIGNGKIRYAVGVAFDQLLPEFAPALGRGGEQGISPQEPSADSTRENESLRLAGLAQAASSESRIGEAGMQAAQSCSTCETQRRGWEEERSMLVQQLDDAIAAMDALQAQLEVRAREHAQCLEEQQRKYEAMLEGLTNLANDRQIKYRQVAEQLSAERDEQRRRADECEAEAARWRERAQNFEAEADARRRELKRRLDAAAATCAAYDSRYTALRHEAEKLVSMLSAPPEPELSWPLEEAAAGTGTRRLQAVS